MSRCRCSRPGSVEHALPDVAPGRGELAELVEEVHRFEIGPDLARRPVAARPEGEREPEQATDQVVGRVLERRALAAREAAELEANAPLTLCDGQRRHTLEHVDSILITSER